jgi:hypothetical protein
MYGQRGNQGPGQPMPTGVGMGNRFMDLLEALRNEYESLQQECIHIKMMKDETESKGMAILGY